MLENSWKGSKTEIIIILIAIFIYFLYLSFIDLYTQGQDVGSRTLISQSYSVEIYSNDELPLGPASVLQNKIPSIFHYEGLKLLTYNNEKYYLFREVNPETCKPEKVFIVDNSENVHVVMGEILPVEGPCSTTLKESNSPLLSP